MRSVLVSFVLSAKWRYRRADSKSSLLIVDAIAMLWTSAAFSQYILLFTVVEYPDIIMIPSMAFRRSTEKQYFPHPVWTAYRTLCFTISWHKFRIKKKTIQTNRQIPKLYYDQIRSMYQAHSDDNCPIQIKLYFVFKRYLSNKINYRYKVWICKSATMPIVDSILNKLWIMT